MSDEKKLHDQRQMYASIARLESNPDFGKFMEYVDTLLVEYTQHCIDAENPARVQGAAQALQRIKKAVAGAEDAYARLTDQGEIPLA